MPLKLKRDDKTGIYYVTGTLTVWRAGRSSSAEIRRSTKSRDKAVAEAILHQIEVKARRTSTEGREPAITFEEAAARYRMKGGEERFLPKPIAQLGHMEIDAIGQQEIDTAALKAYPTALPATVRRQFYAPVLAVLSSNGQRPNVKRPADGSKRTVFFKPEQATKLIDAVSAGRYKNPWSPALVTFLFGQGVRVSEAMAIDAKHDLSLEHRYVILRDTKNGEQRTITLIPKVIAALSVLTNRDEPGPLFRRYDGLAYANHLEDRRGNPLKFWPTACKLAGVDPAKFTPHTARHSWATWFYAQTRDVVRLREEGGWKSDEWQRYVKLATPDLGADALRRGWDFRQGENGPGTDIAETLRAVG